MPAAAIVLRAPRRVMRGLADMKGSPNVIGWRAIWPLYRSDIPAATKLPGAAGQAERPDLWLRGSMVDFVDPIAVEEVEIGIRIVLLGQERGAVSAFVDDEGIEAVAAGELVGVAVEAAV